MSKRVFITAAEVSGDRNAASLVTALLKLDPSISAEGHGGAAMAEAGVKIHHETVGGAAMSWRGRSGRWRFIACCAGRGAIFGNIGPICRSASIRPP